jgi:arylsulfatase
MDKKLLLCGAATLLAPCVADAAEGEKSVRPNIILIMVDDMGYSDIGCYGGEIPTPNIDELSRGGVRYTRFYNTARSCPTRASLLTGLYPHQAGIGEMSEDPGSGIMPDTNANGQPTPGYMGYLNRNCVTIAEVLREAGYHTYMTGKWHVGMHGEDKWPLQRGFERYYGILSGATSYLRPSGGRGLTRDNTKLPPPEAPYYTTDAFTDNALEFMDSNRNDGKPFFLYMAYNAPHWPLQAKQEDIGKFTGKYDAGWEKTRQARFERMVRMGLIDREWGLAQWESRGWDELTDQERANSSLRMSVYAAQIHAVDYNVGRITEYLESNGLAENTLVVFLSDNGACAEPYSETGFGTVSEVNDPNQWVRPSYGVPWAQVSNTPYRKYKVRAYEGGISTPLILSWPARYGDPDGRLVSDIGFLPDIMATFVDAAAATYPATFHGGNAIHPMEGRSLLPPLSGDPYPGERYIFGEHFDNRYVRAGRWKALKDEKSDKWELYDIENDRTERFDLAARHPELLERMVERWDAWAVGHQVYPKR